jgi:hypothetical protein
MMRYRFPFGLALMFAIPALAWWVLRDPGGQAQIAVQAALLGGLALLVLWGLILGRHATSYQELYERAVRRRREAEALEEMVFGPPCPNCRGEGERLEQVYYDRTETSELGIQSLRDCPHCEGRGRRPHAEG